ncbi:phytanoyl-CoA dioxygenase family protein [Duganella rhizosphaerae]|uniref:phytanoyl-CoA dioxygenase family protein n=1 Tax=Duganella rhizosphaerae TaxID=2885763 RepID=UPI00403F4813
MLCANPLSSTIGAKIRSLEVEGFLVVPDFLDSATVDAISAELAALEMLVRPANRHLAVYRDVHLAPCPDAVALIAEARMLAFLRRVLGDELTCMSASYARYAPGYPGMPLHTDCQPYGSRLFGPLASVPVALRVFYYLDELTARRAPLRVVPYSHLCLHGAAHPYQRLRRHPEEQTIVCPRGSAVLINPRLFHAVGPNTSSATRAVYTLSYRPAWAGPTRRVAGGDRSRLQALPDPVRRLFGPPNARRADPALPLRDDQLVPIGASRWFDDLKEE